MLSEAERRQVAEALIEAERTRTQMEQVWKRWPAIDIDDCYAVQSEVVRRRLAEGRRIVGHKIGLTSKAMQAAVGINEPDYGHLLDSMVVADGGSVEHARFCLPRIEMELTFVLGKPVKGPDCTMLDVMRATEYVVPSLEIIDARIVNPRKITDNVADNAAAAGLVMGGRPMDPHDVDLRWVSGLLYRNAEIEETGVAAGVLGHPAMGIAWLANKIAPFGGVLEPGHLVLSGSFIRPVLANKGDTIRGDFGPLGSVSVQFV